MKACKRLMAIMLSLALTLGLVMESKIMVNAAGSVSIPITVTFCQDEARSQLSMVNGFRTGSEAWYWNADNATKTYQTLGNYSYDYNLEKVAMQRAVEIALYYSHTRADGAECWQTYRDFGYSFSNCGENIAYGYRDASAAFEGFKEANKNFDGQGHRRAMLSSSYTACAFACVKYNGVKYWVQEFSTGGSSSYSPTGADNSTAIRYANISTDKISSFTMDKQGVQINVAKSLSDIPITLNYSIGGTNASKKISVSPTWSISDASIATISGNTITGKKEGTATLTGSFSLNGVGYTVSNTVTICNTTIALDYNDITLTPGGWEMVRATISPADSPYKSLEWVEENANIAYVNHTKYATGDHVNHTYHGVVGGQPGTTTITIQTPDGAVKAYLKVTVTSGANSADGGQSGNAFSDIRYELDDDGNLSIYSTGNTGISGNGQSNSNAGGSGQTSNTTAGSSQGGSATGGYGAGDSAYVTPSSSGGSAGGMAGVPAVSGSSGGGSESTIDDSVATANTLKTTDIYYYVVTKDAVKISWKKQENVSGYQIQYSTSKKFKGSGTKKVTVSKKTTSKTIKNNFKGKKCYMRVRTYKKVNGKKVYSKWGGTTGISTNY